MPSTQKQNKLKTTMKSSSQDVTQSNKVTPSDNVTDLVEENNEVLENPKESNVLYPSNKKNHKKLIKKVKSEDSDDSSVSSHSSEDSSHSSMDNDDSDVEFKDNSTKGKMKAHSDHEIQSQKPDASDTSISTPKKSITRKAKKEWGNRLQEITEKLDSLIQELNQFTNDFNQTGLSGFKAKKESRKPPKLVSPLPVLEEFMKKCNVKPEIFTKKSIESMINQYVKDNNLYISFGDGTDKKKEAMIRKQKLEEKGINPASYNKPFRLDSTLKELFKDVEKFPTNFVLYSDIRNNSKNLFREIPVESESK